jgi:TolA-binding protein
MAAYQTLLSIEAKSLEQDFFLFQLGQSYFRLNNFEKAREQYQKVLEDFPKSSLGARVRYEIGNTYYMEGKYDIAIEALKQVVRLNAPSEYATEAQFLMAQSFEHLDKATNAFQMYQAIQDRYPAQEVLKFRMQEIEKKIKEAEKKVKKK